MYFVLKNPNPNHNESFILCTKKCIGRKMYVYSVNHDLSKISKNSCSIVIQDESLHLIAT